MRVVIEFFSLRGGRSSMAEHRTVDARVVGSTPIAHPALKILTVLAGFFHFS